MNQIQGFEGNPSEIFNLTTGMEMIGFSKNLQQHTSAAADSDSVVWKGFFNNNNNNNNKPGNNPGPSSSSKTINESTTNDFFYQQDFSKQDFTTGMSENNSGENLISAAAGAWQENTSRMLVVDDDDDSSLRCVFPCEGNERPSQGLSLSLSSSNPSSIGIQSFELRPANNHNADDSIHQQQQHMMEDGFLGKVAATDNMHHHHHHQTWQFQLRNSKYLAPAQALLNEFCSLGTKQIDTTKLKSSHKSSPWDDENASSSSSRKQSLSSLEFMELQKRKTKLLSMLEEVDRRYRNYCDQMKAVVSYFEAVAGNGAATVYSALASKAMSRHFKCLRDGIVGQIQATKKAMGEKDPVAPGTSKGETPRLKIIDQALRQQRAFQQMNMMESHPWRPQRGLPERSVSLLRAWLFEHFLHPYPSDVDKHILARQTGLSRSQVSNWFINARVRLWKPMVEEMYLEETKEQDNNMASSDGVTDNLDDNIIGRPNQNQNQNQIQIQIQNPLVHHDQKPSQDQLVQIDSECLSSIINNPAEKNNDANKALHQNPHLQQNFVSSSSSFGAMQLDFSSYNQQHTVVGGGVSYANENTNHHHQNFNGNGNGGGVSLTLGLQQHGGTGVSIAFSPASQSSLFYTRDHHIDDCQQVQYSLLDGDHQGQNLPYRNLMGAQLLHDLAG